MIRPNIEITKIQPSIDAEPSGGKGDDDYAKMKEFSSSRALSRTTRN